MDEANKEALMQRYAGALIAISGVYESLAHIQLFLIDQLWPEGSTELDAAADTLEGVKALLVERQKQIVAAAEGLQNGTDEE